MESQILNLIKPDDWHLHLRDGEMMEAVLPFSSHVMGRAVIMPNLAPPLTQVQAVLEYRQRILEALPKEHAFEPLMTLYLTDRTSIAQVKQAKEAGIVAFKLYPRGATTHSEAGVTDIFRLLPVLEEMQKCGLLLLVHGEVTNPSVDIFDRERVFIEQILIPLRQQVPELKIVFEHITTQEAVELVQGSDEYLAATVTPHHLCLNRNMLLAGGIKPHYYCLPVLKRETHRLALLEAVTGKEGDNHKFFLGSDSAPHTKDNKECSCGCAGVFSASVIIPLCVQIFEEAGALNALEAFISLNGARFYGVAPNRERITVIKKTQRIPEYYKFSNVMLVPLLAGYELTWQVQSVFR
ncbi:MAG: dihydroorotase [Neisseriaceae bacterium]